MIYANENDPSAAYWLSRLPIRIDHIDARSISDVKGKDLDGYNQCHFFAGIAGWPLALEMAGWPDDASVWTGSCPCQPFSAAGKRKGTADDRHLWPEFRRLIDECRPATVFGEQVASKDGRDWLATVRADLEALGYAVGAADLCAAGVGAPHIRQRLFWVANCHGREQQGIRQPGSRNGSDELQATRHGRDGRMGDTEGDGRQQGRSQSDPRDASATNGGLAHTRHNVFEGTRQSRARKLETTERAQSRIDAKSIGVDEQWSDVEYIPCRDGKARPIKPGVRCLAHGIPGRVAQLRGLGNAIVPQVAAKFVGAFMDTMTDGGDA